MSPTLKDELKKRGPFDSVEQEATLAILRTSDLLENRIARLLRGFGLTMSQYNVLRILRGEGEPMPCLEIGSRMIQVAPATTRVVDQLVDAGFAEKNQSEADRRVFHVEITKTGRRLLEKIDEPILCLHSDLLRGVSKTNMKALLQILEKIRAEIAN